MTAKQKKPAATKKSKAAEAPEAQAPETPAPVPAKKPSAAKKSRAAGAPEAPPPAMPAASPVKQATAAPPADEAAVVTALSRYRRDVASRSRAVRPDDLSASLGGWPAHVSTKLDGELWFAVKVGGAVSLRSAQGRLLPECPLLAELRTGFGARAEDGEVAAGELHVAPARGRGNAP